MQSLRLYTRLVIKFVTDCGVCEPTFQVWGAHGRHGRGWGLAEALKGSLLSRGVVWSPVLLFLLLLVRAHGLQSQLFPAHKHSGLDWSWSQLPLDQKQYLQRDAHLR